MIILLLILTIILDSIGDALMLNHNTWGHLIQVVLVALWLFIIWCQNKRRCNWWVLDLFYLLLSYALIRHGIFDYTWNLVAGQHIFFVGTTSFYDKYIAGSFIGLWPLRLFCLITGIVWLLQIFKYKLKT